MPGETNPPLVLEDLEDRPGHGRGDVDHVRSGRPGVDLAECGPGALDLVAGDLDAEFRAPQFLLSALMDQLGLAQSEARSGPDLQHGLLSLDLLRCKLQGRFRSAHGRCRLFECGSRGREPGLCRLAAAGIQEGRRTGGDEPDSFPRIDRVPGLRRDPGQVPRDIGRHEIAVPDPRESVLFYSHAQDAPLGPVEFYLERVWAQRETQKRQEACGAGDPDPPPRREFPDAPKSGSLLRQPSCYSRVLRTPMRSM